MAKSSKSRKVSKPDLPPKPYDGFPLTPHKSGRWCKKIRGNLHYFGRWGHRQNGRVVRVDNLKKSASEALEQFNREWPYLKDGRTPPPVEADGGCTLRDLANAFLNSKLAKVQAGELSERSFRDYYAVCERILDHFGKDRRVDDLRPDDFEGFRSKLARRFGTTTLKNEINRVRVVFKYALDQEFIERPVRYGQSFNRPSAKALRQARNDAGPRLFKAHELRTILDAVDGKKVQSTSGETVRMKADPQLRAMILLGINAGFGNTDVASLPQSSVDLDGGWIDFPRPKTAIPRRVPLWPETVEAVRESLSRRPEPLDRSDADLCFRNRSHPGIGLFKNGRI